MTGGVYEKGNFWPDLLLAVPLSFRLPGRGGIAQENTSGIVDKSVVDTTYKVYYLNNDNIHIEGVSAIYTSETAMELMEECLESLKADPEMRISRRLFLKM